MMTKVIKYLIMCVCLSSFFVGAFAQDGSDEGGYVVPAIVDVDGDTIPNILLPQVYVYPVLVFKDKKQEKFYWKTVRDVKKTLPYAKMIGKMLKEMDKEMAALPDDKARKKYMEAKEDELLATYKPVMKKFTLSQGKMLIRLVDRECNKTSYQLIKQFRGGFRAVFWQGFAKMMGANLKTTYDPNNEDDKIVERVINLVEAGQL
ncbi:MAG: DUF4294 domain-containing protein [Paludibacteraceae bacterium]|nr:DUF4294 domain-containing protein [Paludibacteraceae bacterium]